MNAKTLSNSKDICDFFGAQPLQWGTVKVTRSCNLKCRHCYVSSAGKRCVEGELTSAEIIRVIDELRDLGCNSLFLNGGEPFLRNDISELYEHATQSGFKVSTSSNGYHFTESMMKRLSVLRPNLFQVSIDGIERTHDDIRGVDGSFRHACDTLRLARRYLPSESNIIMASTLTESNQNDVLGLLEVAMQLRVNTYCLIPLMPSAKNTNAVDISSSDKFDIFNSIIELHHSRYSESFDLSLIVPRGIIRGDFAKSKYGAGYRCRFPYMLGVDANGDIAPCEGFLEHESFKLGNIKDGGLANALDHPVMKELLVADQSTFTGVCSICKYMESCHGGCRVAAYDRGNTLTGSDPLCQDFYERGYFPEENLN